MPSKTTEPKKAPARKKASSKEEVHAVATMQPEKKTTLKKEKGVSLDVYDKNGKVLESIELPKDLFGAKVNNQLMAQAVRVFLANQRRGTVSTKTRGEVQGSSRKIYRQKGTGRARHGSIRAPIFVHGGLVFGPKPRDYSLKLPQKMKAAALFSALSSKVKDGQVKVVSGLDTITPKTKAMVAVIKSLGLETSQKKVLLVMPKEVDEIKRSARNIEGVTLTAANRLNTYDVLNTTTIILMKDAIEVMSQTFRKEAQ